MGPGQQAHVQPTLSIRLSGVLCILRAERLQGSVASDWWAGQQPGPWLDPLCSPGNCHAIGWMPFLAPTQTPTYRAVDDSDSSLLYNICQDSPCIACEHWHIRLSLFRVQYPRGSIDPFSRQLKVDIGGESKPTSPREPVDDDGAERKKKNIDLVQVHLHLDGRFRTLTRIFLRAYYSQHPPSNSPATASSTFSASDGCLPVK
jgi:hypothetical protein